MPSTELRIFKGQKPKLTSLAERYIATSQPPAALAPAPALQITPAPNSMPPLSQVIENPQIVRKGVDCLLQLGTNNEYLLTPSTNTTPENIAAYIQKYTQEKQPIAKIQVKIDESQKTARILGAWDATNAQLVDWEALICRLRLSDPKKIPLNSGENLYPLEG